MSYLKDLKKFRNNLFGADMTEEEWERRHKTVADRMKKKYPGNYKVEEYFDSNSLVWELRLVFEDQAEEVWFKLKYE
jgi:hypothetical protein